MVAYADILLTGANSFVGGHVLSALAREGMTITATTRRPLNSAHPVRRMSNVRLVSLDLGDAGTFTSLPNRVRTIIHIAAASSERCSQAELDRGNVTGMKNLICYAKSAGAEKIIFTSSLSVHGEITEKFVRSATPITNPGPYGYSKRQGELMLEYFEEILPSVSIRLPGVLGLGAKRHWLACALEKALAGEEITIFNPSAPFNNSVDVDNLSDFILQLSRMSLSGSVRFPIACSGMTTVEGAIRKIISTIASPSKIKVVPLERPSFTIDISEAEDFGFKPHQIEPVLEKFALSHLTAHRGHAGE